MPRRTASSRRSSDAESSRPCRSKSSRRERGRWQRSVGVGRNMRQSKEDLSRNVFASSVTSKRKRDGRKRRGDGSRRTGNANKMNRGDG
jgi:hypothetical protein